MDERVFTFEVEVHEEPDHTWAKALLDLDGRVRGGWGRTRRNPADPERPGSARSWRSPGRWPTSPSIWEPT